MVMSDRISRSTPRGSHVQRHDCELVVADHSQHLEGEIRYGCKDFGEECAHGGYPVEDSYRDEVGNDIGMVHGHRGVEVVSVQRLEQGRRDFPWSRGRCAGHGSPSASTG